MGERGNTEPIQPVVIEAMRAADWPAVREIYQQGIDFGDASFDTEVPGWDEWDAGHLSQVRLVARAGGEIVGWAALSPTRRKSAYRGFAEGSVYVAESARGLGVGRALTERAIEASEQAGIWTIEVWIFPENRASIDLCESLGFRVVGVHERVGRLRGRWRDVVVLERRSDVVGLE
jgi:phosphinothricin acetyltransferase